MKTQSNIEKRDLTSGSVFHTLIVFSLPFMLSTLLQTLYSMVDMMAVGNFVGKEGLSAVATGGQLMELITVFCVGFSTAGQIIISQHMGAHQEAKVCRISGTLCTILAGLALFLTAVGILGADVFLKILNIPPEAAGHAHTYVTICSLGILFTGFYNMIAAVFRGMGDSRHPLIFIAIASVINILLDLFFIGVLKWQVAGAAAATVIGQASSVICSVIFLYQHQKEFYFSFQLQNFKPDRRMAKLLLSLGIPLGLQSSAVQISFLFVNSMINGLGVSVSAVFGAGQKLRNIPGIMTQAIGLGATAMIGQSFGAGLTDRVSKIYKSGCMVNAAIGTVITVVFFLFPEASFRLFTADKGVLEYAPVFMFTLLIEIPAKIFMPSGSALISGVGNTRLSMTLALCDAFAGRIFLTWLFGNKLGLGAFGCFLGYTLATYVTAVPQVVYYLAGTWKGRKRLIAES